VLFIKACLDKIWHKIKHHLNSIKEPQMTDRVYRYSRAYCLGVLAWRAFLVYEGFGLVQTPASYFLYLTLIGSYMLVIPESVRRLKAWCIRSYRSVVNFYLCVIRCYRWVKAWWTWFYSFFASKHRLQPYAILFWYSSLVTFFGCPIACYSDLVTEIDVISNPSLGFNLRGEPLFPLPLAWIQVFWIWFWALYHKYVLEYSCNIILMLRLVYPSGFDTKHVRCLKGGMYLRNSNPHPEFYYLAWTSVLAGTFWLIVFVATGVDLVQTKWTLIFLITYICLVDEVLREMYWRKNR